MGRLLPLLLQRFVAGDMDVIGNDTEDGILALVRGKTLHAVNKIPGENVNIASRLASAVVMRIAELVYDRTNSGKGETPAGFGFGFGVRVRMCWKVGKPGDIAGDFRV